MGKKAHMSFFSKLKKNSNAKLIAVGIGVLAGILVLSAVLDRTVAQPAWIAGTVVFTGIQPGPNVDGTITLLAREYGSNRNFESTGLEFPLVNNAMFEWQTAEQGQTYELQVSIAVGGQTVGTSESIIVTAPALTVSIPVFVQPSDVPASLIDQSSTSLGGTINIDGFIPRGSTLVVQARTERESVFREIDRITTPALTQTWSWNSAQPAQGYIVRAVLESAGTTVGSSEELLTITGQQSLFLRVISGARPEDQPTPTPTPTTPPVVVGPTNTPAPTATPVPPTTISGRVFINGPMAANSSLLMLQRQPGQAEFTPFQRITSPRSDGQQYEFREAVVGRSYEMQAVLQVNEQNTASARAQIVVAPARNVDFTINTGVSLPAPTEKPRLETCNPVGNQFDATILYPAVQGARQYWMQVGTNPGARDLFNEQRRVDANTSVQRVTLRVDGNRNYFSRYAYAVCDTCQGDANFSNFSQDLQFACGTAPTPAPTQAWKGYRCNPNSQVCELVRDGDAPFAPNNTGLEQCQLVCRPATATPQPLVQPDTSIPLAE